MNPEFEELYNKLSERLMEIEARQNYLIQKVGELHHHVTGLFGLEHDAADLPQAKNHLRLQQLACVQLGKMVDADLRNAGIKYFLSAGNLLGAMRTGEFIPWDDDIDFGLMRDDFNRAVELLTAKYNHGLFTTTWAKSGGIFKVLFMRRVCLDLFPWDVYDKHIQTPEEMETFKTEYNAAMDEARKFERGESKYTSYPEITNDMILHGRTPDMKSGDIFEGIDWQLFQERLLMRYHNAVWRNEYILPIGEIEFCGHKFMAPNNPDAWLTTRYGDWRTLNPEFSRHSRTRFAYHEIGIVQDFINGKIQ